MNHVERYSAVRRENHDIVLRDLEDLANEVERNAAAGTESIGAVQASAQNDGSSSEAENTSE